MAIRNLIKSGILAVLILTNSALLFAEFPMKLGGKYYETNAITGKQDLYISKFSQLSDSMTLIVPNLSSGTIANFHTSTITFSDGTQQSTAFTTLTLWDTDVDGNYMPSNSLIANDTLWAINVENDLEPKP